MQQQVGSSALLDELAPYGQEKGIVNPEFCLSGLCTAQSKVFISHFSCLAWCSWKLPLALLALGEHTMMCCWSKLEYAECEAELAYQLIRQTWWYSQYLGSDLDVGEHRSTSAEG